MNHGIREDFRNKPHREFQAIGKNGIRGVEQNPKNQQTANHVMLEDNVLADNVIVEKIKRDIEMSNGHRTKDGLGADVDDMGFLGLVRDEEKRLVERKR